MLFHTLVATSQTVGATASRKAKAEALAEVLRDLAADEVEPAIGFLIGSPRQGKVGVGWATLSEITTEPAGVPTLTVGAVDELFAAVELIVGAGSNERRRDVLGACLEQATAEEADFLRRLVIGELRQGALGGLMADGIAKASGIPTKSIRRAAMLAGDLATVGAVALTQDRAAVEAIGLRVMRPVQPMLASTSASAAAAIEDVGEASVEWKLDGIRMQVHRNGDEVLIVTRNLNDVTSRFPGVVELVRSFDADSLVLDGESIGFSEDGPEAFQDTASQFSQESPDDATFTLQTRFFDILHLDGADLIDAPLSARRSHLVALAGEHAIPGETTADPDRAEELFATAVAAGHEGVMVKAIGSFYEAGRRGKSWRKVKPVHTYDLAILAAEWGHGRRQGWLSNLHLGARGPGGDLLMVGKTFKGLTDDMLRWQTETLLAMTDDQTGHVVRVRPELVVEIAIDGVQRSTRYPGGIALRFARVKGYRTDKTIADVDTIETLATLFG